MKYISTRGGGSPVSFETVLSQGLAPDGGLYVPEEFPVFSAAELKALSYLSYTELAQRVMQPFVEGDVAAGTLAALAQDSYARFTHPAVTPLVKIGDGDGKHGPHYVLELFHGPTLAFKDIALQLLGRLLGHATHKNKEKLTIVGATSGDTGSAAIEGCRGLKDVDVFILYPDGRPSDVQRRQMTCVHADNIHPIAIDGSFDDCQNLVKQLFNDQAQRSRHKLTAVNSINWARIMAQVVYYFYAGLQAGALQTPVNFVVPTGNFGNIYAGYVAKRMGLPVAQLVIATNSNDALARFVQSGVMVPTAVTPTLSPSMDIQIPSNAERYLFELVGRDAKAIHVLMAQLKHEGRTQLDETFMKAMRSEFMAVKVDNAETQNAMKDMWQHKKMLVDPHTAVGLYAMHKLQNSLQGPVVALACAHPAKFPETVLAATGITPELPEALLGLYDTPKIFTRMPNDYTALTKLIESQS